MADKPILNPVRFENGSFYILKDKKLIIEVRNSGTDCDKETTTQVNFRGYGTCREPNNRAPQTRPTKPLAAGESVRLEFDGPAESCFNPDCLFYIIIIIH